MENVPSPGRCGRVRELVGGAPEVREGWADGASPASRRRRLSLVPDIRRRPFTTSKATSSAGMGSTSTSMIASAPSKQLRQNEEELRTITDAIRQFIVVLAPDGTTLYANRVALENTGFTLHDLTDEDLLTRAGLATPADAPGEPAWNQVWRLAAHPDDRDRIQAERQRGFSRGIPFETGSAPSVQDRAVSLAALSVQPAEGRTRPDHPLVRDGNRHRRSEEDGRATPEREPRSAGGNRSLFDVRRDRRFFETHAPGA